MLSYAVYSIPTTEFIVLRSRGDSGQNEAERTNSAIGDAVVDGATIEWDKFKQFESLSEEEIEALSVKEYEGDGKEEDGTKCMEHL